MFNQLLFALANSLRSSWNHSIMEYLFNMSLLRAFSCMLTKGKYSHWIHGALWHWKGLPSLIKTRGSLWRLSCCINHLLDVLDATNFLPLLLLFYFYVLIEHVLLPLVNLTSSLCSPSTLGHNSWLTCHKRRKFYPPQLFLRILFGPLHAQKYVFDLQTSFLKNCNLKVPLSERERAASWGT